MKVCVKYFDNFLFTATHWIPMAYKNAFYFNALQEQEENQIVVRIEYYGKLNDIPTSDVVGLTPHSPHQFLIS